MSSAKRNWSLAAALLFGAPAFAAAACGPPPAPTPPEGGTTTDTTTAADTTTSAPAATEAPTATGKPPATATATASAVSTGDAPSLVCKLASPVKSTDACTTDADCGVSDPCHAHACVAKAKSHPPDKSTICTRLMDCNSADANTCGCLNGVCALYPR